MDLPRDTKIRIVKIVLFVVGVTYLILSLRTTYERIIDVWGYWGWIVGLSHQYPPIAYLFFKNSNTPEAVITLYYNYLNKDKTGMDIVTQCGIPAPELMIMGASGPRQSNVECTAVGYMEANRNKGYNDCVQFLLSKGILPSEKGTTDQIFEGLNFVTSYVLPFAFLFLMV